MKQSKELIRKVRNRITNEEFYTSNQFPEHEIDGVKFMSVKRKQTDERIFLVKKDSVEYVK